MKRSTPLEWDTIFFGYPVYRLNDNIALGEFQNELTDLWARGATLIQWNTTSQDDKMHALARSMGGALADAKRVYRLQLSERWPIPLREERLCFIQKIRTTMTDGLLQLAYQSGEYSRYRRDVRMQRNEFERLYEVWLRRSLAGEIADSVWVADDHGKEAGFLTLDTRAPVPAIGLIAVDKPYRGQSAGKSLLDRAVADALAAGHSSLTVATQRDNRNACDFYESYGFTIASETNIYHFWRNTNVSELTQ